jgi:hydroxymethylbilane synthase
MRATLRLGTRRSALALTQSRWVAERLEKAMIAVGRPVAVELVEITTHGDVTTAPLSSLGGTGVFVSALRDALLDGTIDLAVHSLKDLPTAPAAGLVVGAIPVREDPRDVLVASGDRTAAELPAGSRVGTGSPRRAAQLRALGFGLDVVDIRGNVDTRLRKVSEGDVDAVVLARAGLLRIGREAEATEVFDPLLMLPAPGQGALAVECRDSDTDVVTALAELDDLATRAAVTAERALLARLEAGCAAPVGALGDVVEGEDGEELSLRAVVASIDGAVVIRRSATVPLPAGQSVQAGHQSALDAGIPPDPEAPPDPGMVSPSRALNHATEAIAVALGRALAEQMLADGAADLMPVPAATSAVQVREGDL